MLLPQKGRATLRKFQHTRSCGSEWLPVGSLPEKLALGAGGPVGSAHCLIQMADLLSLLLFGMRPTAPARLCTRLLSPPGCVSQWAGKSLSLWALSSCAGMGRASVGAETAPGPLQGQTVPGGLSVGMSTGTFHCTGPEGDEGTWMGSCRAAGRWPLNWQSLIQVQTGVSLGGASLPETT